VLEGDGPPNEEAKGELALDPLLLNEGAGELWKASKPLELPPPVEDANPPTGPETSGIVSILARSSSSGLSGVSVPLSATYPPYKTKSNRTTTTAVFRVCTSVLHDREFNNWYSFHRPDVEK
jgi:hypothetical protein